MQKVSLVDFQQALLSRTEYHVIQNLLIDRFRSLIKCHCKLVTLHHLVYQRLDLRNNTDVGYIVKRSRFSV